MAHRAIVNKETFFGFSFFIPAFSVTCIGDIFHGPSFDMSSFDMLCSQAWQPKHAFTVNMAANVADSEFITAMNILGLPIPDGRLVKKLCCLPKLQMGKR